MNNQTEIEKRKNVTIQVLNIKFISNPPVSEDVYLNLLKQIHEKKLAFKVPGGKYAILRLLFESTVSGQTKYLYGKFSKFTSIDGKDWIDLTSLAVSEFQLPPNLFPNLIETDFVFVPKAHRFALLVNSNFNIFSAQSFFQSAIKEAVGATPEYDVIIEQSEDIFREIIEAEIIEKLEISISYSNSDNYKEAEQYMDEQIKKAKARSLDLVIKPKKGESISLDSQLVKGAIGVAKKNGFAHATIKNNGKKKYINTERHPEKLVLSCDPDNVSNNLAEKILDEYRQGTK